MLFYPSSVTGFKVWKRVLLPIEFYNVNCNVAIFERKYRQPVLHLTNKGSHVIGKLNVLNLSKMESGVHHVSLLSCRNSSDKKKMHLLSGSVRKQRKIKELLVFMLRAATTADQTAHIYKPMSINLAPQTQYY